MDNKSSHARYRMSWNNFFVLLRAVTSTVVQVKNACTYSEWSKFCWSLLVTLIRIQTALPTESGGRLCEKNMTWQQSSAPWTATSGTADGNGHITAGTRVQQSLIMNAHCSDPLFVCRQLFPRGYTVKYQYYNSGLWFLREPNKHWLFGAYSNNDIRQ